MGAQPVNQSPKRHLSVMVFPCKNAGDIPVRLTDIMIGI